MHSLWPIAGANGEGRASANRVQILSLSWCAMPPLTPLLRAGRRGAHIEPRPQARPENHMCPVPDVPGARRARCKWHWLWDQYVLRGPSGSLAGSLLKPLPNAAGINIPGVPACLPADLPVRCPSGQRSRACSRPLLGPPLGPSPAGPLGPCLGKSIVCCRPPVVPPSPAKRLRGDKVPLLGHLLKLGAES